VGGAGAENDRYVTVATCSSCVSKPVGREGRRREGHHPCAGESVLSCSCRKWPIARAERIAMSASVGKPCVAPGSHTRCAFGTWVVVKQIADLDVHQPGVRFPGIWGVFAKYLMGQAPGSRPTH